MKPRVLLVVLMIAGLVARSAPAADKAAWKAFTDGQFSWKASAPLVTPSSTADDPAISIKDPTIVHDQEPLAHVRHRAAGLRQGGY